MDQIIARLLLDTGALGVWLLGPVTIDGNRDTCELLASAIADASIAPPVKVVVQSETYFDFGERKVFALPVGAATLVVVFSERTSLGVVRLRAIKAKVALQHVLAG